jgi:hypothetical protein
MLRYLHTLCDLLSSVCALVSPVIIFHWLMKVADIAALRGVLASLDPVFLPLNSVLEVFIKLPNLTFNGHTYSTLPCLLAILLTCAFFLFNFLSETIKVTEQRMSVEVNAQMQRQRLKKLQADQQRKEQALPQEMKVFAFVDYDVTICPAVGEKIEQLIIQEAGHIHSRMFNEMALEFRNVEQGLRFALGVSQIVLSHYATLRPLDPQPPFKVSLHGVDKMLNISSAVNESRKLIQFLVQNQVIVSQSAKQLLDASGTTIPYRLQSMGVYAMETGTERELFRLFAGKQASSY